MENEAGFKSVPAQMKSAYGNAYNVAFGNLREGTKYAGVGLKSDTIRDTINKALMVGLKAASYSGANTGSTDRSMFPVYVDPKVTDISRKFTPLREIIPRVTQMGLIAAYERVTSKDSAAFVAEDAPSADQDTTRVRDSETVKFLQSVGRVTGPAQAAQPSYVLMGMSTMGYGAANTTFMDRSAPNALQNEILMRTQALFEREEYGIVNGNASSTAAQFNGIVAQQSTTNQTSLSAEIEISDVDNAIAEALIDSGHPTLGVGDIKTVADLRKRMVNQFSYRPGDVTSEITFGVPSQVTMQTQAGPVAMISTQQLSTTSGSKSVYFLDMAHVEMRVLQDATYQALAQTNDSQKFLIKMYECLLVRAPEFNSFIDTIS